MLLVKSFSFNELKYFFTFLSIFEFVFQYKFIHSSICEKTFYVKLISSILNIPQFLCETWWLYPMNFPSFVCIIISFWEFITIKTFAFYEFVNNNIFIWNYKWGKNWMCGFSFNVKYKFLVDDLYLFIYYSCKF